MDYGNFSGAKKFFAALAIFAVLGFLMAGCLNQGNGTAVATATPTPEVKDNGKGTTPTPTPTPQVTAVPTPTATETKTGVDQVNDTITSILPNGVYQEDATYAYHSGVNTVHFSVTVKDDVVTGVSVTMPTQLDPISTKKVTDYAAALPNLVVGKKIDSLNLPKNVAGSSLTNAAFQDYVASLVANHGAAS